MLHPPLPDRAFHLPDPTPAGIIRVMNDQPDSTPQPSGSDCKEGSHRSKKPLPSPEEIEAYRRHIAKTHFGVTDPAVLERTSLLIGHENHSTRSKDSPAK